MKVFTCLFVGSLLIAAIPNPAVAQASYGAEAYAARQQEEERWRKISAQMEELITTQEVLRKRIAALEDESRSLRAELTKCCGSGVSPEEFQRVIKQVTDKLKEVDDKRVADNKMLIEQLKQSIRDFKPATTPQSNSPTVPGNTDPLPPTQEGYTHVVQDGQTISAIVKAFRAQGVNTSTKAILDANPGLEPRKLKVGQEVFVPKPR